MSIKKSNIRTELFGTIYDAPFGIAPVGLQGLMWPNSPEILAKAAFEHNIPFILSTVTTSSIERIAEITEGKAWFQLYHPTQKRNKGGHHPTCGSSGNAGIGYSKRCANLRFSSSGYKKWIGDAT